MNVNQSQFCTKGYDYSASGKFQVEGSRVFPVNFVKEEKRFHIFLTCAILKLNLLL